METDDNDVIVGSDVTIHQLTCPSYINIINLRNKENIYIYAEKIHFLYKIPKWGLWALMAFRQQDRYQMPILKYFDLGYMRMPINSRLCNANN